MNSDANSVGNTLTVFGPYIGNSGSIYLRTVQHDSSPSDQLVIHGGTAPIDGAATATGTTLKNGGTMHSLEIEVIYARQGEHLVASEAAAGTAQPTSTGSFIQV